jgi:hypothetical protein
MIRRAFVQMENSQPKVKKHDTELGIDGGYLAQ